MSFSAVSSKYMWFGTVVKLMLVYHTCRKTLYQICGLHRL